MLDFYHSHLKALTRRSRIRQLQKPQGLDFSSNDYLALSSDPFLKEALQQALVEGTAVGAGASRLLCGTHQEHEAAEAAAVSFFKADSALFMGGGYLANLALFGTLPQRADCVIVDEWIHASVHDGLKLGRAQSVKARHHDLDHMESLLKHYRQQGGRGRPFLAVESLYSMDGDFAPLPSLVDLANRYEAFLIIDEAHATGIYGPGGRGLAAQWEGQENILTLHTCGKALGGSGAFILGPRVLRDYLVNRARPFVYATAPSPCMAVVSHAALTLIQKEPERREKLRDLVECAREGLGLPQGGSQILPLLVGDPHRTMQRAHFLQQRGFDIRGIRPPTVPEGTSRLRISITLKVTASHIREMCAAVFQACEAYP